MFCLYCGNKLPDDALFCNGCGRQQHAVSSNASAIDVTLLPGPPLPQTPISSEQSPGGNVPLVQGTSSTLTSPPGQNFRQSSANFALPVTGASVPALQAVPIAQSSQFVLPGQTER